ncbi:MAG: hypothetical protein JXC32_17265 [Anaerolineae bacterium]|nr:hypothetical protein [Anaerolineae bacterium]
MILDGHIHIGEGTPEPEVLAERMTAAGIDGGLLISQAPASFSGTLVTAPPAARLENLLAWASAGALCYPAYWIDPTETDALDQVDLALSRGVVAFKVICDHFYPGDVRALNTFRAITEAGKPVFFHSGILWDGKPSSNYSRPANFEALLQVRGMRFSLAHISWPWVDECIAVYGKLNAAKRRAGAEIEMFIDTTPGTPPIYRREALTKVYTVGYDVAGNVFFGSDGHANSYNGAYARQWIERDKGILADLDLDTGAPEKLFAHNLQRFLGVM